MTVLDRAGADLAGGRRWKARERLEGALANDPTNQAVLDLLGEICFAMGDLPAAGGYWFLTERSGTDVDAALGAMNERFPTPSALFTALPVKAALDAYPASVRARLERLVDDDVARWMWSKKLRGMSRKARADVRAEDTSGGVIVGTIAVAFVGVWLLGALALFYLVVAALRALT